MTLATSIRTIPETDDTGLHVNHGFLKLTRVSELGEISKTPSYVRAASIIHMNRDSWRESHTWVWLTDDRQLRVLETPEAILEALG